MRVVRSALAVAIQFAPMAALAQTVDDAQASSIEQAIAAFLSPGASGIIKIKPAGDHFDLTMDLTSLFDPAAGLWRLSEVTPIVRALTPNADGTWSLKGDGPFALKADSMVANRPNSVSAQVAAFSTSALVDPGLGFARTAELGLKDASLAFRSGQESLKFRLADFVAKMTVENLTGGKGTLKSDFIIGQFAQTFGSFPNAEVTVRAQAIKGVQRAEALDFEAIKGLGQFHREQKRKSAGRLSDTDTAELRLLLQKHVPLVGSIGETTAMTAVSLESAGKGISAGKLDYRWSLDDIAKDGAFTIGAKLSEITAVAGTLPKGADSLLPQSLTFNLTYTGFKIGALMQEWADDPRGDRLRQDPERYNTLLAPGLLTMTVKDTAMKSAAYDISLDGNLSFTMANTRAPNVEMNVVARDFDQTVKFLQEGAKTTPELGQLAFGAMMAKGFGQAQPDGSMLWKIEMDGRQRQLLVNGQRIGG